MSTAFDHALKFVLPHETEFVRGHWGDDSNEDYVRTEHDADDPGGTTRYGIDQRSHPGVNVERLTKAQAVEIYRKEWNAHNLDALPEALAICAFDVWVNGGDANRWLQHAYNVVDEHGALPFLQEDGVLGPVSLKAFQAADQAGMVRVFLAQRDARFKRLSAKPRLSKYIEGWLKRDSDLSEFLLGPATKN